MPPCGGRRLRLRLLYPIVKEEAQQELQRRLVIAAETGKRPNTLLVDAFDNGADFKPDANHPPRLERLGKPAAHRGPPALAVGAPFGGFVSFRSRLFSVTFPVCSSFRIAVLSALLTLSGAPPLSPPTVSKATSEPASLEPFPSGVRGRLNSGRWHGKPPREPECEPAIWATTWRPTNKNGDPITKPVYQ